MKYEKYEIEIPNLPEGVRPTGTLSIKEGELVLIGGRVGRSVCDSQSLVKLELLPGYEVVGDDRPITIRRKPVRRVRIEFDMPENYSGPGPAIQYDAGNHWGYVRGFTTTIMEGESS